MATPERPTFILLLRDLDGSEREVAWESVTGEEPAEGDEVTVDGRTWRVVAERDGMYLCAPAE
jgi:hypothetical protein